MSVFKMIYNRYNNLHDLENLVHYAIRPEHCIEGIYGAQGVSKGSADEMYQQMYGIKSFYNKKSGRQAMHFVLSFSKEEERFIGVKEALEIGYIVAGYFTGWQVVFGVHTNEDNLHIHFVLNTVSYENGLKFSIGFVELQNIKRGIEKIVEEYHARKRLFIKCMTIEEIMTNPFPPQFPCETRIGK